MRSVASLCVFLALVTLVLSTSAQTPNRKEEVVIHRYGDSACTRHLDSWGIPQPDNTKCVDESTPQYKASSEILCAPSTTNKTVIDFAYTFWFDSATCNGSPGVTFQSSGPTNSCVVITVTTGGKKSTDYGRIQCNVPATTTPQHSKPDMVALFLDGTASTSAATRPRKSLLSRLFNW
jgi:hypothetical protein